MTEIKTKKCLNKECELIGVEQPIENFHKTKETKDKLKTWCKKCSSLYMKEYRLDHKEEKCNHDKKYRIAHPRGAKETTYQKEWAEKNRFKVKQTFPEKVLFRSAKARALRDKLQFSITIEDIKIPEFCPILGIPLFFSKGGRTDNTPSLDRIDNNLGYIKENIAVISWKANNKKRDITLDECYKILKFLKNNIQEYYLEINNA